MVYFVVVLHYYTVVTVIICYFIVSMHDVGNCNLGKSSALSQRSVTEFDSEFSL